MTEQHGDLPAGIETTAGRLLDVGHQDGIVVLTIPGIKTVTLAPDAARHLLRVLPVCIAGAEREAVATDALPDPYADVVMLAQRV